MTQLIPFESAQLPAYLTAGAISTDLVTGGDGFPVISIKGKVFHVRRGDERTLLTRPDDPNSPAAFVEVVILRAGPAGRDVAKVYYDKAYVEGSDESPACYSNNGQTPATDAASPQASQCAVCPRNVWGSRITEDGRKSKQCVDSKRLAVAAPGAINDPMLLRVPAASLKALSEYGAAVAKRGVRYNGIVTRIGFDYSVAHPALTFRPVGFIDQATMAQVDQELDSETVLKIVGAIETVADEFAPALAAPAPAAPAPAAPAPAAPAPARGRRRASPAPAIEPSAPTAPAPAPAVPPAKPAYEVVDGPLEDGLDDVLSSLDFDD